MSSNTTIWTGQKSIAAPSTPQALLTAGSDPDTAGTIVISALSTNVGNVGFGPRARPGTGAALSMTNCHLLEPGESISLAFSDVAALDLIGANANDDVSITIIGA